MKNAKHLDPVSDAQAIIDLIDEVGMAFQHSNGNVILKDGTSVDAEQWDVWIRFLEREQEQAA